MSGARALRIGTRGSALALAQSGQIAAKLPGAELVTVETEGDRSTAPLDALGGTGVFATELRRALLAGEIDAIVHSFKDLPTAPADGLTVAAVPKRADARDALCARDGLTLAALSEGALVGTGSPRRRAQLLSIRPDLRVVGVRGNVDTRLGRVTAPDDDPATAADAIDPDRRLDAVVLALAGLTRLGRESAATELFDLADWPTAAAQGALAIETRAAEAHLASKLDHRPSRLTASAERAVLAVLEAGCAAPIGVTATLDDGLLFCSARVYTEDGAVTASHALYPEDAKDPAGELAARIADELHAAGVTL